jgi:hypothetical protein
MSGDAGDGKGHRSTVDLKRESGGENFREKKLLFVG